MNGNDLSTQIAEPPKWLIDQLQQKAVKPKSSGNGDSIIAEGRRNDFLTKIAGSLHHQGVAGEVLFQLVMEVNNQRCNPPLLDSEVRKIAQSVDRYPIPDNDVLISAHDTDDGNALRLQAHSGNDLLYVFEWKIWLVWDGNRWREATHGEQIKLAKKLILDLYALARNIEDDELRKKFINNARALESMHCKKSMMESAQSLMPANVDDLDRRPMLYNVVNGTIDLRTIKPRPGSRKDLLTKSSCVIYDPAAKCPNFLNFLTTIFAGDSQLIRYIQKVIGYTLTGDISEQCFFLLFGRGNNGKTTLIEVITALLGEYATKTRAETFLKRRSDSISNDLAALFGARFIAAVEPDVGRHLNESRIKEFTGRDRMSARRLYQEYFQFRPVGKLFIATNRKPQILGRDEGIWRRVHLIPFNVSIPKANRIEHMEEILLKELSGILNWALEGCLLWQAEGLGTSPAVQIATQAYRAEEDSLLGFTTECCKLGRAEKVQNKQLRNKYLEWCHDNEASPIAMKEFRPALEDAGFTRVKVNGVNIWKGIGLGGWY